MATNYRILLEGIKNRIRNSGILGKSEYGKTWQDKNNEWYAKLFSATPVFHENFMEFIKNRKDIRTVLEVGCGAGVYPIKYKDLFSEMKYTGIDISKPAIAHCKENSDFEFICGDLIKMNLEQKYDLVFSQSVIDHVYDIDLFLSKIIKACTKYTYVSSYRGYFPEINKHKMMWRDDDGCYYNDLSVKQVHNVMINHGLKEDEFIVRKQETGQKGLEFGTVIEINRKL